MRIVYSLAVLFLASSLHAQEALDKITVESDIDKSSQPLVSAPGSFVRKERDDIKSRVPDKLENATGLEPNIEFTGGPRLQSQLPQIRGLDASRILILEEGVRQNFASGHNGRIFSDLSLLENVEIVKGPWSSLYGSGAMGGVISFRRSTAADFIKRSGKKIGGELAVDGSSAERSFGERATGYAKAGFFEPLVSYRQSKSHDIRLGDGTDLPYSGSETQDLYSSLGFQISERQSFTMKLDRYTDEARVPLEPNQNLSSTNLVGDEKVSKNDVVGDYKYKISESVDIHARPYWRKTDVQKTQLSNARVDHQVVETTGIDAWNNVRFGLGPVQTVLTSGVEAYGDRDNGSRNGGALASFPDGQSQQLGLYAQPSFSWNDFTLTPGLRYDSYTLKDSSGLSGDSKEDNTSLKVYGSYEFLTDSLIFAGFGQGFNAPRLQDIYISGQHFPGNFFVANPDLKPERSDTFETGVKSRLSLGDGSALSNNVTYFRTDARDFINRDVNMAAGTTQFENLNRVRLEGFEASSVWQRESFGLGLSYGQTRSTDKGTGEPLADTMPDQWAGIFNYYLGDRWTFGTTLRYSEAQTRVPAPTQQSVTDPTPAYFTQDFDAGYRDRHFDVRLRLNNAFDRDYRRHASAIKDTGRDIRFSVSYLF